MSRQRSGGEWPVWFIAACLVSMAFWGTVIYVAWHFIEEGW